MLKPGKMSSALPHTLEGRPVKGGTGKKTYRTFALIWAYVKRIMMTPSSVLDSDIVRTKRIRPRPSWLWISIL